MHSVPDASNPFALLINPAAVFAELERSDRLNRLSSRVCRPLDKPQLTVAPEGPAHVVVESADGDDGSLAD